MDGQFSDVKLSGAHLSQYSKHVVFHVFGVICY